VWTQDLASDVKSELFEPNIRLTTGPFNIYTASLERCYGAWNKAGSVELTRTWRHHEGIRQRTSEAVPRTWMLSQRLRRPVPLVSYCIYGPLAESPQSPTRFPLRKHWDSFQLKNLPSLTPKTSVAGSRKYYFKAPNIYTPPNFFRFSRFSQEIYTPVSWKS
jgi:hypothetical protein